MQKMQPAKLFAAVSLAASSPATTTSKTARKRAKTESGPDGEAEAGSDTAAES